MTASIRTLVIAGTSSGAGKTSVSLGLARAFTRRGLKVQTFKVGPDYLDPTYLRLASGRTCYNLDCWMCGSEYAAELFARKTRGADLALVEGVMGLFDGTSAATSEGSTAEIARLLGASVVLVANAKSVARSFGALVKGYAEFEDDLSMAGVIANRCGSERHVSLLRDVLASAGTPPLLGGMPQGSLPELPHRHLGLITADSPDLDEGLFDALADACEKHLDLDALLGAARPVSMCSYDDEPPPPPSGKSKVRIGVARDEAFHFYYPDNLEALERGGAEIVPFSPLADAELPPSLDAIYLGGGYPEAHARRLSENKSMRRATSEFAASGGIVYAECGGLMYLARALVDTDGTRFPMAQVLPLETRMRTRRKALGYVEVTLEGDSLWGKKGDTLRGHEYHYSEVIPGAEDDGWRRAYSVRRNRDGAQHLGGFQAGNVLAGYIHLHFASRPVAVESFLATCRRGDE